MKDQEIYVSTDIEADGPIPGPHSMLSLGSAAFTEAGQLVDSFYMTLETMPGASGHPETMNWWKTQPEAWAAARHNIQPVELVMRRYATWLKELPGKPVFVGYPAGYDFTFVYWYLMKYTGSSPYSFSALDIKTLAMAALGLPFRESTKKRMPAKWFPPNPHTHKAIDDAMEQGLLFINILKHLKRNAKFLEVAKKALFDYGIEKGIIGILEE